MLIIDAHTHIWAGEDRAYPWAPHDQIALPTAPATAEQLIAELDEIGAAGVICIQPRVYGYDHAYLNDALARFPDRLAGVCVVNPLRPAGPVELRGLVRDHGYCGLRLNPMADPDPSWLDGPDGEALWNTAAELDLVVSLLVQPEQLHRLTRVAERYSGVQIVIDHLGRCTPTTPAPLINDLLRLADWPNLSVKVSALSTLSGEAWPYSGLHPVIEACYRAFGPDRLLWGTDFPYILANGPYARALDAVPEAMQFIATADLPAILGGNAARIYRLPFGQSPV